jgi:hypothetical protein
MASGCSAASWHATILRGRRPLPLAACEGVHAMGYPGLYMLMFLLACEALQQCTPAEALQQCTVMLCYVITLTR